ncbi:methyl-accepting chemotaxis protein [Dongia sp. agr-C8]
MKVLSMGIRGKIVLAGIIVTLLGIGGAGGLALWGAFDASRTEANRSLLAISEGTARQVGGFIQPAIDIAQTVARTVEGGRANGLPRTAIRGLVTSVIGANKRFVGVTVAFEPDGYDGKDAEFKGVAPEQDEAGRYVPYFFNMKDGTVGVEKLIMTVEAGIEGWYLTPLKNARTTLTPPYIYPVEGVDVLMATISVPMQADGKGFGIATVDLPLTKMSETIAALKPFGTGQVMLIADNGTWAINPDAARIGKTVGKDGDADFAGDAAVAKAYQSFMDAKADQPTVTLDEASGTYFVLSPVTFDGPAEKWTIVVSVPEATVLADAKQLAWTILAVLVAAAVIAALVFVVIGSRIAKPIVSLSKNTAAVAAGDLQTVVTGGDRRDEIGTMARTLETFKQSLAENQRLQTEQQEMLKRGSEERKKARDDLAASFEAEVSKSIGEMATTTRHMATSAEAMSAAAQDNVQRSGAVEHTAGQVSDNVQSVAAAVEELAASIREISQQVNSSSSVANSAADRARGAVERVNALVSTAEQIGSVITLINDIASQTNLLALNATIEAARAGEAGKGFAVVASEVKNLAMQTAKATDEISTQVQAIQQSTGTAAAEISEIAKTIEQINQIGGTVAAAVTEQEAATGEISRAVTQAASGTSELRGNIQSVAETARRSGQTASDMQNAVSLVGQRCDELQARVDDFLKRVRAG